MLDHHDWNNLRWNRESQSTLGFGVSIAYIHQFHVYDFVIKEEWEKGVVVSQFGSYKKKLRTKGFKYECMVHDQNLHLTQQN